MKVVNAYIKPHKLAEVTLALQEMDELPGVTICDVRGFGRQPTGRIDRNVGDYIADYAVHVKLEIVCCAELVERIVEVIVCAASTGLRGDGLVYITDVEGMIRISDGERGLASFRTQRAAASRKPTDRM